MFNDIIRESISFCLPALQILTYWPLSSWLFPFIWLQYDCRSLKHHILTKSFSNLSVLLLILIARETSSGYLKSHWPELCYRLTSEPVTGNTINIITRANSNQSAFCFSKLFLLWKHSWLAMLVSGVPQSIFLQIIYSYKSSQVIEYRPLCYTVNPCCVSVSCIIVCVCLSQPLNLSSPSSPW